MGFYFQPNCNCYFSLELVVLLPKDNAILQEKKEKKKEQNIFEQETQYNDTAILASLYIQVDLFSKALLLYIHRTIK